MGWKHLSVLHPLRFTVNWGKVKIFHPPDYSIKPSSLHNPSACRSRPNSEAKQSLDRLYKIPNIRWLIGYINQLKQLSHFSFCLGALFISMYVKPVILIISCQSSCYPSVNLVPAVHKLSHSIHVSLGHPKAYVCRDEPIYRSLKNTCKNCLCWRERGSLLWSPILCNNSSIFLAPHLWRPACFSYDRKFRFFSRLEFSWSENSTSEESKSKP